MMLKIRVLGHPKTLNLGPMLLKSLSNFCSKGRKSNL